MAPNSRPFLAGNWKMHTDREGARRLAETIAASIGGDSAGAGPSGDGSGVDIALFPPFPFLADVATVAERHGFVLGAQNLHAESEGAFTGEVSGPMLRSVGCTAVLVGHSERRHLFGETDDTVAAKTRAALGAGLRPIVCVGETREQREAGTTEATVLRQIRAALEPLPDADIDRVTVAYEPVWAIGTGLTATPDQAAEVHATLRRWLDERFGPEASAACRLLYGGSVKPDNVSELLSRDEIQGALVGGASLDAASFAELVRRGAAARSGSS